MFYNARWYDTSLGRFTQADSIIPAGVQGYDRYAYVNNAPVNLTDPSGHMVSDGLIGEGGGCDRQCWDERNPSPAQKPPRGGGGGNNNLIPKPEPDDDEEAEDTCVGLECQYAKNNTEYYMVSDDDLDMLATRYEDNGWVFTTLAGIAALVALYPPAAIPAAIAIFFLGNEAVASFRISSALKESAEWARQNQNTHTAIISYTKNKTLGVFSEISYTNSLGYEKADTIWSLFQGGLLQNDLERDRIVLPIFNNP